MPERDCKIGSNDYTALAGLSALVFMKVGNIVAGFFFSARCEYATGQTAKKDSLPLSGKGKIGSG
jgi:hypothetical protein